MEGVVIAEIAGNKPRRCRGTNIQAQTGLFVNGYDIRADLDA
jgi:hypothetical protein